MKKPKVLVIVGPTASGKSDLAVHLSKKFNGEVISADSRQVYKGLDIGTGKITKKEMLGIPHHLLDVVSPNKQFSVSEYRDLANKKVKEILENKRLPVIAGGTGFYIDSIVGKANFPDVPANKKLREKLEKKTKEELFKILKKKDPRRAKEIDPSNKVRIIRALEIIESLGSVPKIKQEKSPYQFVFIGIKPDKEELDQKIYKRLLKRTSGMIREAKKLHASGLSYKRMLELGLEYRYLAMYLKGEIDKAEMAEMLNSEIKKYAKRQMTWFKRNKKIKWFKTNQQKDIEKYLAGIL